MSLMFRDDSTDGFDMLSSFIRLSRYAMYKPECKRRETWEEQVARVFDMHRVKFKTALEGSKELREALDFAQRMMLDVRILGSQRSLQMGGPPILRENARMYNCAATYVDRVRAFQETMWTLLCGSGMGVSLLKCHVDKLPPISAPDRSRRVEHHAEDSIEGWADCVGALLSSYFVEDQPFPDYAGCYVSFDYSRIRPKGSAISDMSGKAPGSGPLQKAIESIRTLLDKVLNEASTTSQRNEKVHLRPLQAADVIYHAADAVVSGGIRRSAILTMIDIDDEEFVKAKTGDWFQTNPQRARTNISVLLNRKTTTREQFDRIIESTKEFGEPGFIWADHEDCLYNPCVEIGLYAKDSHGQSGTEFCNLSEVNMRKATTKERFLEACRAASILGTFQAGYTDFSYLGEVTERIVRREALLGVSMNGMMDNPSIAFDAEIQKEGAAMVRTTNEKIASLLGIHPAARLTAIKPSGTSACLIGSASGAHAHHAKRFIRRVQVNKMEPPLAFFKQYNPHAVEESLWSANRTDDVISFLCEIPEQSKTKQEVSAVEFLKLIKRTQDHWIQAGTTERNVFPWLKHNVSNTVNVKEHEWEVVADYIYTNRDSFAGVALISNTGDKDYKQATFQAIHTPVELAEMYGDASVMASGLIVHAQQAFQDLHDACNCFLGIGETLADFPSLDTGDIPDSIDRLEVLFKKRSWMKRAEKFTRRYFMEERKEDEKESREKRWNHAKRRMCYLLKDVDGFKTWCDLKRTMKPVPWGLFSEEENHCKPEQLAACAGGSCELQRI
jgi:ribonucleoside-triphosphate reductase